MSPFPFLAVARRKRTAFTSAKMAALKGNTAAVGRFLLAALHSVAKRVSRGQAYHPQWSVPVGPKTAPHASAATIHSFVPLGRAIAHVPWSGIDPKTQAFWFWLRPRSSRLFSQQRSMGTCCAGEHAGTVRCRWARLPRVDPLCDRMERGEEEAVRAAAMHLSAAIFADVQARSFRRAAAENCRPAIFEARATLREQSGSTLGRRVRQPSLSPFARNRRMSPFTAWVG